ncbi:hypothetical protein DESC_780133 [Desulfosarcina cetonica]|nr:hypothetical protein DESC_780133 [Desulfosarcina cetonica]
MIGTMTTDQLSRVELGSLIIEEVLHMLRHTKILHLKALD